MEEKKRIEEEARKREEEERKRIEEEERKLEEEERRKEEEKQRRKEKEKVWYSLTINSSLVIEHLNIDIVGETRTGKERGSIAYEEAEGGATYGGAPKTGTASFRCPD